MGFSLVRDLRMADLGREVTVVLKDHPPERGLLGAFYFTDYPNPDALDVDVRYCAVSLLVDGAWVVCQVDGYTRLIWAASCLSR